MDGNLTYRVGGCKDPGSISDSLDLFVAVAELMSRRVGWGNLLELFLNVLGGVLL